MTKSSQYLRDTQADVKFWMGYTRRMRELINHAKLPHTRQHWKHGMAMLFGATRVARHVGERQRARSLIT